MIKVKLQVFTNSSRNVSFWAQISKFLQICLLPSSNQTSVSSNLQANRTKARNPELKFPRTIQTKLSGFAAFTLARIQIIELKRKFVSRLKQIGYTFSWFQGWFGFAELILCFILCRVYLFTLGLSWLNIWTRSITKYDFWNRISLDLARVSQWSPLVIAMGISLPFFLTKNFSKFLQVDWILQSHHWTRWTQIW